MDNMDINLRIQALLEITVDSEDTKAQAVNALNSITLAAGYDCMRLTHTLLENIIQMGNTERKQHVATMICYLSEQADNKKLIIPTLIEVLRKGNSEEKHYVAFAIRILTENTDTENLTLVKQAGGIVPLVYLLSTGNVECKIQSAWALTELVRDDPENQKLVAQVGGIESLVDMLRTGGDDERLNAAAVLYYMTFTEESRKHIQELGITRAYLEEIEESHFNRLLGTGAFAT
jgi:hypothetical protein|uniref:Uncharacterized protein n=1 Tax=viral metagenome TaxID=1070528 RepID=A0A6C0BNI7_9ZZZZ